MTEPKTTELAVVRMQIADAILATAGGTRTSDDATGARQL